MRVVALFNGKKYDFETNYTIVNMVSAFRKNIESHDNMYEFAMTANMLLVHSEARDHQERIYNIDAYDWDGNHLWNIADILSNIQQRFTGFDLTTREMLKGFVDDLDSSIDSHELLTCVSGVNMYIIDLHDLKILKTINGKW